MTQNTGLASDYYDLAYCNYVLNHIWSSDAGMRLGLILWPQFAKWHALSGQVELLTLLSLLNCQREKQ